MTPHKVERLETKTFAQLMSLAPIEGPSDKDGDEEVYYFRSLVAAYKPIISRGVFGGHVMAQSAYAASKTVPPGYICHNFHSYFLLPGNPDVPFYYKVNVVRNGKTYMTREIHVYQPKDLKAASGARFLRRDLVFVAMASFKTRDKSAAPLLHQRELASHFRVSANRHRIQELELAPDVDIPMWIEMAKQRGEQPAGTEMHPLEVRKMDTSEFNKGVANVADRTQIHFFKSHDKLSDDMNLHVAALLYVSDRNSLFTIANLHDREYFLKQVASIDHAFVMHKMDARVDVDWMTMETYSSASSDGRGLYQGHIYDENDGLVCSFMQDGVLGLVDEAHKMIPGLRPKAESKEKL